ncbi:MAG: hypothetical protein HQK51_21770 [Oligoflexia bacterium]|nr:hypothetical protein [Oligoflexia bacterium]
MTKTFILFIALAFTSLANALFARDLPVVKSGTIIYTQIDKSSHLTTPINQKNSSYKATLTIKDESSATANVEFLEKITISESYNITLSCNDVRENKIFEKIITSADTHETERSFSGSIYTPIELSMVRNQFIIRFLIPQVSSIISNYTEKSILSETCFANKPKLNKKSWTDYRWPLEGKIFTISGEIPAGEKVFKGKLDENENGIQIEWDIKLLPTVNNL